MWNFPLLQGWPGSHCVFCNVRHPCNRVQQGMACGAADSQLSQRSRPEQCIPGLGCYTWQPAHSPLSVCTNTDCHTQIYLSSKGRYQHQNLLLFKMKCDNYVTVDNDNYEDVASNIACCIHKTHQTKVIWLAYLPIRQIMTSGKYKYKQECHWHFLQKNKVLIINK